MTIPRFYHFCEDDVVPAVKLASNCETVTVDDESEERDLQSATQHLESTLADLCKQRDALLHKLAEARSSKSLANILNMSF